MILYEIVFPLGHCKKTVKGILRNLILVYLLKKERKKMTLREKFKFLNLNFVNFSLENFAFKYLVLILSSYIVKRS